MDDGWCCHGPCSVTFFPKNNQRMAPTESPMMAASPLFSATITTGHPHRTYIGAPLEYSLTPIPPTKPAFLSLSLPTNTMCYLLQHNHSPTMLHTRSMFQANHIAHTPVSRSVKLGVRTEMSGPKSCEALASTCRLRRSLAGCLEFRRSGWSRRVWSRAEKKLKKTRAS